jgi:hypothetical protein
LGLGSGWPFGIYAGPNAPSAGGAFLGLPLVVGSTLGDADEVLRDGVLEFGDPPINLGTRT